MPKMDPKSPQNRPQCVPGRPLASWLHPVIFGHAIFTISDAKMAPKMTLKWHNRAPNGAQDHQNIALSSKRSLWHRPFGRLGPHSKSLVANGLILSKTFPKNWGGAGGEGEAHFSRSHQSASKPSFSTTTSDWHGAALLCNLDICIEICTDKAQTCRGLSARLGA